LEVEIFELCFREEQEFRNKNYYHDEENENRVDGGSTGKTFIVKNSIRKLRIILTPFFIGGLLLCATNTVVRSFFGQAMSCSFCSPETQNFQKK